MVDPKIAAPPLPAASGKLAQKPLAHLLIYSRERQLTGSMELRVPSGAAGNAAAGASVMIVLAAGKVSKVQTSEPVAYLGHVLYELGHIDDAMLSSSLSELAASRRLHGSILLEKRAITHEELHDGLRHLRLRKLEHAFTLPPDTEFAFYNHVDLLPDRPHDVEALDVLPAVWRALRETPPLQHVRAALGKVEGHALRVQAGTTLDRLGLNDEERAAADCLRLKALSVEELTAAGFVPQATTELLAYYLLVTKHVEVVERPGVPAQAVSSIPPRSGSAFGSGQYAKEVSFSMRVATPVSAGDATARAIASTLPPRVMTPSPPTSSTPPSSFTSSSPVSPRTSFTPSPGAPSPESTGPKGRPAWTGSSSSTPPATAPRSITPGAFSAPFATPLQSGTSSSSPPSQQASVRRKTILDRARFLESEDYFKVLMIDRGATSEEIREAYFKLTKQWHPDTLPASLADVKRDSARIFARMTAAYETLMDADRRRRYEEQIGARAQDATEADSYFAQAEMNIVLGDHQKAEQLCRRALVTYPGRPEYAALLVWLEMVNAPKVTDDFVRSKIVQLDMALSKDPQCRRASYYRGMLYKRLDEHDAAIRDLRRAVENDPDDADADRELRVYERQLRDGTITLKRSFSPSRGTEASGHGGSGLFERFRRK